MSGWCRLWQDMPNDPKWRVIARKAGRPLVEVLGVFVHLMTNASANATERGRTQGWNNEDVAAALDVDEEHVEAIIQAMQGKVLEGDRLTGWDRRQPKREDNSAARSKAWRENQKNNSPENKGSRTQPNATERNRTHSDAPDIDADIDADISNNPPNPPSQGGGESDEAIHQDNTQDFPVGFVRFWQAYPEGHRQKQKDCFRIWQRKNLEPQADSLIADIKKRSLECRQWQQGYTPSTKNYLSGECWNDDLKPMAKANSPPKSRTKQGMESFIQKQKAAK